MVQSKFQLDAIISVRHIYHWFKRKVLRRAWKDGFVLELDPNMTNGEANWIYSLKCLPRVRR